MCCSALTTLTSKVITSTVPGLVLVANCQVLLYCALQSVCIQRHEKQDSSLGDDFPVFLITNYIFGYCKNTGLDI